jgi:hypothetical protein
MAEVPNFLEGTAFGVLNDIISSYHDNNGYAQPNKFDVVITPPAKNGGGGNENVFSGMDRKSDIRDISMRCESVQLPGRNLATSTDSNIYGPTRDIVEGVTYAEDLNMVFQASSGLDERVFFENWQRQAFDEKTWNIGYYNDYIGDIDIYLLDKQNKRRYGLKIHEAYPKTITATDLNSGTNNEIIKISVSFSFRYWTALNINQQAPNVFNKIFATVVGSAERNLIRNQPSILNKLF